ncbi:MAG: NAD(P)H-binding protein, partial [Thermoleophilia bacterium]|nr:NAD(P)H-binding protein [Thermoleophilia bacterium]
MDGMTLVLGANGKTGRRVAARLQERGAAVRAGSRAGRPPFDWYDPGTWGAALEGVDAAYVSFFPDLAVPGAPEIVGAFARQAAQAGVGRLVLLSGRGEEEAQRAERELAAAGVPWTVVRASWFSQNFSEGFLRDAVLSGEVALPVEGMVEPFVDVEDIADVAVAALTGDGHAGRVYEVTGPRAITFAEAVAEIGRASGREVRFTSVTLDAFTAALAGMGEPPAAVALVAFLFTEVLDGRNARPAGGVRDALGREAGDFAAYAARAAAAGAWSLP